MMFVLILLLYLLLAAGILAWIVFPPFRERLSGAVLKGFRFLFHIVSRQKHHVHDKIAVSGSLFQQGVALVKRHRLAATLVCLMLIFPTVIAIIYRHEHLFLLEDRRGVDAQILALMQGERLAAPLPLPIDFFTTREVEDVRPRMELSRANRKWECLDPEFVQKLLSVYKVMEERYGYEMVLLEGYRTPERQARLLALGATRADSGKSYHQKGLAADSAFLRNGKIVITEKDPWAMEGYRKYGELAEIVGLTWGGRWKSLMDFGHVELRKPGALQQNYTCPEPPG